MEAVAASPTPSRPRKHKAVPAPRAAPQAPASPVLSEDEIFFGMISRLPADTGADRIEKLFQLHERMKADRARRAFDVALLELQADLPVIAEKGKTSTGSYARYEDIVETVRPICLSHGFTLTHRTEADRDRVRVTAILSACGHREENGLPLPHDTSDNKSAIHAEASAVSYGKRITALAILGIVTRGEDDDGKRASQSQEVEMISAEQKLEVLQLVASTGSDIEKLLAMWKLESIDDVAASKVPLLKAEIRAAAKQKEKIAKEAAK